MIISDLKDEFEDMKHDITDVDNALFIRWADYLNKFFYRYLTKTDPEQLISTQDYTVATSPSSSAEPTDYGHISSDGTGFYTLDSGVMTGEVLTRTGPGRDDRGYYFSPGDEVTFTGITDETFRLRYIPTPVKLTATSDELIIPDRYSQYMIDGLDVIYNQWDEDAGMESLADIRMVRGLNMVLLDIPKDQRVYEIYDNSNAY
ncbi:hypothetical protein HN682_08130 [Candidatus Peregrinibacteria bacterium]|nr:hypothetical protein [Candidatus Peregrinibacteria bacterium]